MNTLDKLNANPTMSSIEIVDYINEERRVKSRENGTKFKALRHDHFMVKVPKVIGESLAPKFLGTVNYANGNGAIQERKAYHFPKREACLMAMSYSYEIQAKVFDRMTYLEECQAGGIIKRLQDMLVKAERLSFTEHGQKGSRLMHKRKKEKQELKRIEIAIKSKCQLTIAID